MTENRDARGLQSSHDTGRGNVFGKLLLTVRIVHHRGDHPERSPHAQQRRSHLRHTRHPRVEHDQVEIGILGQELDLLGIPDQHRRRGIQEAAGRHQALGVGHFDGNDQVNSGGIEHLRRGLRLVFFLHQRRTDRLGIFTDDAADLVRHLLSHRPDMRRFVVIIFEQCHDQNTHFGFHCHLYLPFDI